MKVSPLCCESLSHPLGVDVACPRLSWTLESDARGQRQTAYQILVASSAEELKNDRGDLWDSGRIESDRSIHVEYDGKKLRSFARCHGKVRVWDKEGHASEWSEPSVWEMGLLKPSDWKARWIAPVVIPKPVQNDVPPSPILRKEFHLKKAVKSARAYISGLGYCELFLNGRKVGDHVLDPVFTRYDRRVAYVTHDLSSHLTDGINAIGVMLGNGWYNCHTQDVWHTQDASWRDRPKMILQIRIELADGTIQTVVSDPSWKASTGPVVFDGLRNGETYDAREEKTGWNTAGFDDRDWGATQVIPEPGGALVAQMLPPIRVMQTITPIRVTEVKPGVHVYDMGQAFSGWAQLTVQGAAGTTVILKYAEKLTGDGDIDPGNINRFIQSGECQTDAYILKGGGREVWEPRFTYHGFRYVQVTGFPGTPSLDNLCGRVVHTDLGKRGEFSCSNDLLNKIQQMILWSTVSNYHGIPTDCPHREKNGWTGDAHLSAEQVLYNFDPAAAYTKWMDDFRDAQRPSGQLPGIVPTGGWGYNWGSGPAWDIAYLLIPWYLYRYGGDTGVLARHYEGMKCYVDFMASLATDHIVSFGLGDWCPPKGHPGDHRTPVAVTSTAYFHVGTRILAQTAELLGKTSDARRYRRQAETIRKAFIRRFYDPENGTVTGGDQTAMSCALYQGLVDSPEVGKVLAALVAEVEKENRHIGCGILGAKYVMHTLHDHDRDDLAYAIATQTDFPSWGQWVKEGATTLWESWSADGRHCDPSLLHHMFSDIGAWFYRALAGIDLDPDQPGFKYFLLRPSLVGDLTWVRAEHRSPYGLIRSDWKMEGDTLRWNVCIPVNTTATVCVPAVGAADVTEGDRPAGDVPGVNFERMGKGRAIYRVGSGSYCFQSKGLARQKASV